MSASSWDDAVPVAASPAVSARSGRWSLATRIAFRFAFVYFLLYVNPVLFELVPYARNAVQKYFAMWERIVPAVAKALLGIRITTFTNGSGDTTFDFVKLACVAAVAAVVTLLWSILDRRRMSYTTLHEWLRVYIRFSLAVTMIAYGAAKVIKTQFPDLTLDRLLQPFGDASPMGLLWTLMGASAAFNVFTGAGEMLGGLLLTMRRTTLLGALMTIAVMSNIVAMNFCYDVPVKLFSLHLLAMAVFLILPDLRRLMDFFVLYRPPELIRSRWLRAAGIALRTAVVVYITFLYLRNARQARERQTDPASRSPLYGIWNVDTFDVNGVSPLVNDATRWRRVVFDHPNVFAVQTMNDSRTRYWLTLDERKSTMLLEERDDPSSSYTIIYRRPDPNSLVLDGSIGTENIHAILHRTAMPSFRLTTRGFHWINEYPFNR